MNAARQMKCLFKKLVVMPAIAVVLFSCEKKTATLFAIREGDDIGIDFENTITTNDSLNAISFEYIYNGSGVGVGDFNDDGLPDLFFGGNQVSCKLYLNRGGMKFEDVTEEAGVTTTRWITGVSVIDINQDGRQDVYLSVAGKTSEDNRKNLLFINQGSADGIPSFKESASMYGLDDGSYSTMAAFFDYDKDGDPDLYLVNNWLETFNRNNLRAKRVNGEAPSTDKLYRNNGDNTFTDVSREAGILIEGYGLGINIADLNNDSWPDVYVANDFMSNDLIWINQQNGTFKNMAGDYLKHQTHNGMGIDIADFNNDELSDIIVVDMLPPGHIRQKMMTPGQNYDHFHMSMLMGYQPQYMRNTLQLNRGLINGVPAFSEIAFMAGVAKTDWSWAPLFADFDNDGWKDLFIANGYRKDVTDLDFIFFGVEHGSPFGTTEARKKILNTEFNKIADVKISNYVFKNSGTLSFQDKTEEWGIELPTFTNGAAYADLDNDGDMDLITNNIDQQVIVFENRARQLNEQSHFIKLRCNDKAQFNQKVWIYSNGQSQYQELTPYRGFQSSVSADLHFGLGANNKVDSIKIVWPNGKIARYKNVTTDTVFFFAESDAKENTNVVPPKKESIWFERSDLLRYTHRETSLSDIKVTRTLLHELTRFGPCIASADVNGDNLDDIFIGGEARVAASLMMQRADGSFKRSSLPVDSIFEDGAAAFFDSDNDGDNDLYVGGSCASGEEDPGPHRLFINDGKGSFTLSSGLLPELKTSASCVIANDFDNDGDQDLFVGGRIKPRAYPFSPLSYILRNDGREFTNVTTALNADLASPGMISDAAWADVDRDGKSDLVLVGEWMPVRVFKNNITSFKEISNELGLSQTEGWWNCVEVVDLNGDAFPEIIAGNTGKNSFFQPTKEKPVQIVAKDFDKNSSVDPIVTYYNEVEKDRFIVHNRLVVIDQIPWLKKRFETFRQYASAPFEKALTEQDRAGASMFNVYSLSSKIFVNHAGKTLSATDLPEIAQLSVINDILVTDVNKDGRTDLITIGNNYSQETLFGRYDASFGAVFLGDGKLNWTSLTPSQTNFFAAGDAKFMQVIKSNSGRYLLVVNNNSPAVYFKMP
jgi:hypothetical protein